ncbi:nucleotide-binding protein [Burkholderia sp.]|uniref:nucleotide-binding protein n=1 Tax=Burkholderia sp. TaxID=36773 RepID=UPI002582B3CF|nr:nucleotide-binding protein [Burkholderia sp.]MCL4632826.1 nucleotide-binding protein [Burkholderia sp.]
MAKLAGICKAVSAALNDRALGRMGEPLPHRSFPPDWMGHQFKQAAHHVESLRALLPTLYGDFQQIPTDPTLEMLQPVQGAPKVFHYSRDQLGRLVRDIDQVFEIRANSELSQPSASAGKELNRVFISHGRSNDWREVQAYIEKDIGLATLELAQEPSAGQTIIEKLESNASFCDSAVIVMTGDDVDAEGQARSRENVMHEIGYFQAKYGRSRVCLLHEEAVSIPTNLSGVVYVPFPKSNVGAAFGVLIRELKAMYKL